MIRQMIKKGDPLLRLKLPQQLLLQLQDHAKRNKRKTQDEMIKRLCASLNNEAAMIAYGFEVSTTLTESTDTVDFAQVVPSELKDQFNLLCQNSNLDLNQMITVHLASTFSKPEAFGLDTMSEKILKQSFSHEMAINECKRHRQSWLYIYEREKLKLYLRFEKQLPRNAKERFMLLDAKSAIADIQAELASEGVQD